MEGFPPSEQIPQMSEIPTKYIELMEKSEHGPKNPELWNDVINLAKEEEGTPRASQGPYGNIPLDSMIELANKVRGEQDPIKRYNLVMEESPNGKLWFDVIKGFNSATVTSALAEEISKKHWGKALELGVGTGNLTEQVSLYCDDLVVLDRVPSMLEKARARVEGVSPVRADATALPFSDGSFDLVTSLGLYGSFDAQGQLAYLSEVSRVLKSGGVYIDASFYSGEDLHPEEREELQNAKGILAMMINDTVAGRDERGPRINQRDLVPALLQIGLYPDWDRDKERKLIIQTLTKFEPKDLPRLIAQRKPSKNSS